MQETPKFENAKKGGAERKTPLEIALENSDAVYSCLECENSIFVRHWWYCKVSGKLLHPMMLEHTSPLNCKNAILRAYDQGAKP